MIQAREPRTSPPPEIQHSALLNLLTNSLVLSHTAPYLSCYDVLNLAATSRAFRFLIYHTPQVFRRLELGNVKSAQFDVAVGIDRGGETWRNVQLDENLTEEEYVVLANAVAASHPANGPCFSYSFYSGPLRGIFASLRRLDILREVQILCLDGLSVTADLVHDIITDPSFSVRILSIRGVKNLNEPKLRGALRYACRQSRPKGTPRLKGLYIFGAKDAAPEPSPARESRSPSPLCSTALVTAWNNRSQKALKATLAEGQEAWYARRGQQLVSHRISPEWGSTLVACDGIIAFDSVLCTGPRHFNSPAWGTVNIEALNAAASGPSAWIPQYSVATHSLGGCASCGSAPEGWTVWGEEGDGRTNSGGCSTNVHRFPLLAPPPLHSASVRVAMCPTGQPVQPIPSAASEKQQQQARFIPRCFDCIRDRYCAGCHRWWCESCYLGPFVPSSGGQAGWQPAGTGLVSNSPPDTSAAGGSDSVNARIKVWNGMCLHGKCPLRQP